MESEYLAKKQNLLDKIEKYEFSIQGLDLIAPEHKKELKGFLKRKFKKLEELETQIELEKIASLWDEGKGIPFDFSIPYSKLDKELFFADGWIQARLNAIEVVFKNTFSQSKRHQEKLDLDYDDIKLFIKQKERLYSSTINVNKIRTNRALRAKFAKEILRQQETFAYHLGIVRSGKQIYCSDNIAKSHNLKLKSHAKYFRNVFIHNKDTGSSFSLMDVVEKQLSNRSNEDYAFTKALEEVAEKQGLDWGFFTFTADSEFHINPKNGKKNWNGMLPNETHKEMMGQWRKLHRLLNKYGIRFSGLRVVEPHKDGTPHIHFIAYYHKDDEAFILETIKKYFPNFMSKKNSDGTYGDFMKGDKTQAMFSSYVFKYIKKHAKSFEERAINNPSLRVEAWRSLWDIRAFQWFGIPSKTLYRKLQKSKDLETEDKGLIQLQEVARACKTTEYLVMNGGLTTQNKHRPFKLLRKEVLTPEGTFKEWNYFVINKTTGASSELKSNFKFERKIVLDAEKIETLKQLEISESTANIDGGSYRRLIQDGNNFDLNSKEMDEAFELYYEIFHKKGFISKEAYRIKKHMSEEKEEKQEIKNPEKPFYIQLFEN